MEITTIIIAIVIIGGAIIFRNAFRGVHEDEINAEIKEMGGNVINIERRNFFTGIGPFMTVGKGRTVYRVEYEADGQTKEIWVRFGGLFGSDWRE